MFSGRVNRALLLLALAFGAGRLSAHPEIDEALVRINAELAATPRNAELYLDRGELYARHEEWISAEANYLTAAEIAPKSPRLARARAALALATGQFSEAKALLDAALTRDPRDADALILRSRVQAALGEPARAVADLDAALRLVAAPTPELFLTRAALLPPENAVRSLDEGIARIGPAIPLELRAAAIEESLGRIDAALARLDALAARSERKETWLKRRGDLLARAGRAQDARAAYTSALSAIATLPGWLRDSPDVTQLATELTRLAAPHS